MEAVLMTITANHPFYAIQKKLDRLVQPLFSHSSFSYFAYERYGYDGLMSCTHQIINFSMDIFNKKLLPTVDYLHKNRSQYVDLSYTTSSPAPSTPQETFWQNILLAQTYDIYHRLYFIFNQASYVEIFCFGLKNFSSNQVEIYLNEKSILEKFCIYFRDAGKCLLDSINQHKIIFDEPLVLELFEDLHFKNSEYYIDFLKDIDEAAQNIRQKNQFSQLSKREYECLYWIAKNKTAKQIAKILSLSPRTTEFYISNLKNKLACHSKLELIEFAMKNSIIRAYTE